MSSVNTGSDAYNYYTKQISQIEDEMRSERDRAEKNNQERVESLEKNYEEQLRKREAEANRTIENARENASEHASREREVAAAEVDRLKALNYDKTGRNRGVEADTYLQQLKDTADLAEMQKAGDASRLKEAEAVSRARMDEIGKDYEVRLSKAVEAARDSANETYNNAMKAGKEENKLIREESSKKYVELDRERLSQQDFERKRFESAISEAKRDFENQRGHADRSTEYRLGRNNDEVGEALTKQAEQQRESRALETSQLREQIIDASVNEERSAARKRGQDTSDAIREYEDTHRHDVQNLSKAYEQQLEKMRAQAGDSDSYNARLNSRNLSDKDTFYSEVIHNQNLESHLQNKELQHQFERNNEQLNLRNAKDKEVAQQAMENQAHTANEERYRALDSQAKAFQETLQSHSIASRDEVSRLQNELSRRNTSGDTSLVSPTAESNIRRNVLKEYEKVMATDMERNKRATEGIQQNYSARLQNTTDEAQMAKTKAERFFTSERHSDQARFVEHIQETEYSKESALRNKDYEHDRVTDSLQRNFAHLTTQMRNEYETLLQTTREDAANRIGAIRQENDFATREKQRAFTAKQNELIREYEKKLADQKIDFDSRADELRSQAIKASRDAERRIKISLEEQARGYDQRIATNEVQAKERERYLTQNHQDELEKVKRANALQQKKS